jgi:hypothetical protein
LNRVGRHLDTSETARDGFCWPEDGLSEMADPKWPTFFRVNDDSSLRFADRP